MCLCSLRACQCVFVHRGETVASGREPFKAGWSAPIVAGRRLLTASVWVRAVEQTGWRRSHLLMKRWDGKKKETKTTLMIATTLARWLCESRWVLCETSSPDLRCNLERNRWSSHVPWSRRDYTAFDQMDVFTVNTTLLDSYPHVLQHRVCVRACVRRATVCYSMCLEIFPSFTSRPTVFFFWLPFCSFKLQTQLPAHVGKNRFKQFYMKRLLFCFCQRKCQIYWFLFPLERHTVTFYSWVASVLVISLD